MTHDDLQALFAAQNDARRWAARWRAADNRQRETSKALAESEARRQALEDERNAANEQPFPWSFDHTAERLHVSTRKLRDHLKDIEAQFDIRPYHMAAKKRKIFTESDVKQLQEAIGWLSNSQNTQRVRTGTYAGQSEAKKFSRLQELLTDGSPKTSASSGKRNSSTVVSMERRRSQRS